MADRAFEELPAGAEEAPPPRRRGRWWSRIAKALVGLFLLALIALAGLVAFLDTDAGHRWIADRIAAQTPESGLDIRIGRIDGSIWGDTLLRDVRLYDPDGLFAESPRIELEWQPLGWIANRLLIDELRSELVIVHRLPRLRPAPEPRPILPDFDIRIGRLEVAQLRFEKAVTGQRRVASLAGGVDIRSGRALVDVRARVSGGGDDLALVLDAEPDRDHFDIDVRLNAPANSVTGAIVGTKRPIQLEVKGDGRWSAWAGTARLNLSGRRTADLALRADSGRYSLSGSLTPSQFLKGKQQRLTAPRVLLNARATLADRRLDGSLSLRSSALKVEAKGAIDLARSAYDEVSIAADLLQPAALFPNMTGQKVRLTALLDGAFRRADFAYRITSPRIAFDDTGFEEVRAEGKGRLSREPVTVPVRFTARRVTGVGDVAGGILANLRIEGLLKVTRRRLTGEGLALTSDKLNGKLSLFVDLVNGQYDVILSGGLARYLIPGLGIVDVLTELKVVEGPGGRGTMVTGRG
ncbi:MAG TPA: translocation/assembly module TamB, partial [Allosphingosinicella sp.]